MTTNAERARACEAQRFALGVRISVYNQHLPDGQFWEQNSHPAKLQRVYYRLWNISKRVCNLSSDVRMHYAH